MGFQEALSTCFSKYAKADGRASRPEFWYFHLAAFVYMFIDIDPADLSASPAGRGQP